MQGFQGLAGFGREANHLPEAAQKYSPAPAQRIVGHMLAKPIQLNSSAVKNILYNTYYLLIPTLHQEEL